jgi:hypothetical protein
MTGPKEKESSRIAIIRAAAKAEDGNRQGPANSAEFVF